MMADDNKCSEKKSRRRREEGGKEANSNYIKKSPAQTSGEHKSDFITL